MIEIHPFHNADPPVLLEIWQKCANEKPQYFRPLSPNLLEQQILGSPYFDRKGLFLAKEGNNSVGFAHAAFGPNADYTGLDYSTGIICLVMITPDCQEKDTVAQNLLDSAEDYLISSGATQIYGGASRPIAPFYMGLYAGSEPIGVFVSDHLIFQLFRNAGYNIQNQTVLFRISLEKYRIPISAKSAHWRRKIKLEFDDSAKPSHWWEACMMCHFEWLEMNGSLDRGEPPIARVAVRIMESAEPSLVTYYMQLAGLLDIEVDTAHQKKGLGAYLLGEMIRELQHRGVKTLEIQAPMDNLPLVRLLTEMHWERVEEGTVFLKTVRP